MKFTRIDKNTIRAIVTEEDMQEHGIKMEDFFKDQNKVQDFLRIIVEKAGEEIGYEAKHGIMSMQVTPLSKGAICITFSDNDENGIESMLRHIKDAIDGIEEMDIPEPIPDDFLMDQLMNAPAKKEEKEKKEEKGKKPKSVTASKQMTRVFRFSTLSQVEAFCEAVPFDKAVKSDLIKDEKEGGYYLILEKSRLSVKNFNAICEMATEFSKYISDRPARAAYLKEHGTKIIEKKAVAVLKKLGR